MGEVDSGPSAPAEPMPDMTVLEVDPAKGERFFKAALIHSKQGTTYRMVAKALADGRLDLVHFVCDLSADGTMNGKRRIRRIESQKPERWDTEIATIEKEITGNGEEVQKVWSHDLTGIQDVAEQVSSLNAWMVQTAKEMVQA